MRHTDTVSRFLMALIMGASIFAAAVVAPNKTAFAEEPTQEVSLHGGGKVYEPVWLSKITPQNPKHRETVSFHVDYEFPIAVEQIIFCRQGHGSLCEYKYFEPGERSSTGTAVFNFILLKSSEPWPSIAHDMPYFFFFSSSNVTVIVRLVDGSMHLSKEFYVDLG